jgi:hypothetical protein
MDEKIDEKIDLATLPAHVRKKVRKILRQAEQQPQVKKYMLSARVPAKILDALDEYRERYDAVNPTEQLVSRTSTLLHIVREACSNMGFDVSELPEPKWTQPQEYHEEEGTKEEKDPEESDKDEEEGIAPLKGRMAFKAREKAKLKEAEEKAESTKASKTEVVDKPEPKKKEPVTPTQATQKPTPEKRPEPLRMGASEPQEPSVAEETPKDQPPVTVGDPDSAVQQAAYIRTLREKSKKKPEGQQTLGPEKERQDESL